MWKRKRGPKASSFLMQKKEWQSSLQKEKRSREKACKTAVFRQKRRSEINRSKERKQTVKRYQMPCHYRVTFQPKKQLPAGKAVLLLHPLSGSRSLSQSGRQNGLRKQTGGKMLPLRAGMSRSSQNCPDRCRTTGRWGI